MEAVLTTSLAFFNFFFYQFDLGPPFHYLLPLLLPSYPCNLAVFINKKRHFIRAPANILLSLQLLQNRVMLTKDL